MSATIRVEGPGKFSSWVLWFRARSFIRDARLDRREVQFRRTHSSALNRPQRSKPESLKSSRRSESSDYILSCFPRQFMNIFLHHHQKPCKACCLPRGIGLSGLRSLAIHSLATKRLKSRSSAAVIGVSGSGLLCLGSREVI